MRWNNLEYYSKIYYSNLQCIKQMQYNNLQCNKLKIYIKNRLWQFANSEKSFEIFIDYLTIIYLFEKFAISPKKKIQIFCNIYF